MCTLTLYPASADACKYRVRADYESCYRSAAHTCRRRWSDLEVELRVARRLRVVLRWPVHDELVSCNDPERQEGQRRANNRRGSHLLNTRGRPAVLARPSEGIGTGLGAGLKGHIDEHNFGHQLRRRRV